MGEAGLFRKLPEDLIGPIVKEVVDSPEFVHFLYDSNTLTIRCPNLNGIFTILSASVAMYRWVKMLTTRSMFVEHLAQCAQHALNLFQADFPGGAFQKSCIFEV